MPQDHLRVASYNIRKARGLDGRRDPGRILDVMNRLDADVIAVQEMDRRLGARPSSIARRMIETHTDFIVADVARSPVSLGWHGNAILVRRGLSVYGVDHIDLPGLEPRGAVRAEIGRGEHRVSVVGAHLGLLRPWRRAQAAQIRNHLGEIRSDSAIILGDFNEWSLTHGLEPLAEAFEIVSPGRSFHAARPMAALDRLALSPEVRLLDAGVLEDGHARVASDHLPIWGEVELTPSPSETGSDLDAP